MWRTAWAHAIWTIILCKFSFTIEISSLAVRSKSMLFIAFGRFIISDPILYERKRKSAQKKKSAAVSSMEICHCLSICDAIYIRIYHSFVVGLNAAFILLFTMPQCIGTINGDMKCTLCLCVCVCILCTLKRKFIMYYCITVASRDSGRCHHRSASAGKLEQIRRSQVL